MVLPDEGWPPDEEWPLTSRLWLARVQRTMPQEMACILIEQPPGPLRT